MHRVFSPLRSLSSGWGISSNDTRHFKSIFSFFGVRCQFESQKCDGYWRGWLSEQRWVTLSVKVFVWLEWLTSREKNKRSVLNISPLTIKSSHLVFVSSPNHHRSFRRFCSDGAEQTHWNFQERRVGQIRLFIRLDRSECDEHSSPPLRANNAGTTFHQFDGCVYLRSPENVNQFDFLPVQRAAYFSRPENNLWQNNWSTERHRQNGFLGVALHITE